MRKFEALVACGAATIALGLGCGGDDTTPAPASGKLSITGGNVNHSMNRLAEEKSGKTAEYSQLEVQIVSNDALAKDANAAALATAALNTTACQKQCSWTFDGLDVTGVTLGLSARIRDTRTSGAQWITTVTTAIPQVNVTSATQSGAAYKLGHSFGVTRDAIDTVMAPMVGLTADEVLARGVVFGIIYSTAEAEGTSGTPLVGATVTPADPAVTIVYPNGTFSGTSEATAAQGAFFAIPKAGTPSGTLAYTINNPAGQTLKWDATNVGVIVPGSMHLVPIYPSP